MANGIDKFNFERQSSKLLSTEHVYNGHKFVSQYAACEFAGVSRQMVARRMRERNEDGTLRWTLQQAIDAPKYARVPLSVAGATLHAVRMVLDSVPKGGEHAAVKAITRLGALYLKENPDVQNQS